MTLSKSDLKPHQVRLSQFIQEKASMGGCLCFLGLGAGKTGATIDALYELHNDFKMNKCLIVSTKKIIDFVWPMELLQWQSGRAFKVATRKQIVKAKSHNFNRELMDARRLKTDTDKKLKVTELKYLPKPEARAYRKACTLINKSEKDYILNLDANIYLMNAENYVWLWRIMGDNWPFDTQVFDESSLFKNHSSKMFKAAKKGSDATFTNICLTATPKPNGYQNLWSQTCLVDGGQRLGKNITAFREQFCFQVGFSYKVTKPSKVKIRELIQDIVISMDTEGSLETGEPARHEFMPVVLDEDIASKYKELERDYVLELKDNEIVAQSAASLLSKLKQFCSGTVYGEEKEEIFIHDKKMEALKKIKEAHSGENLIVVYEYRSQLSMIMKHFPEALHMDKFDQSKWDKKEVPMLVTHPKSGGHGLNLQHGGRIIVWLSPTIDLELYQQMNGRINEYRQAQSGYDVQPIYYHLAVAGSVEESIIKKLNAKDQSQVQFLEALREELIN